MNMNWQREGEYFDLFALIKYIGIETKHVLTFVQEQVLNRF